MKIERNTAVTVRLKLQDATGKTLSSNDQPVAYLHGGYDNIFPKLEAQLEGQEAGFKTTVELAPEDAFGQRDESLMQTIPKSQFPPGVKVGGQLEARAEDGTAVEFTVIKVKGDKVLLDANHPYAGKALRVTVNVLDVRAATEEEITHGHVHGAHGHHH